MKLNLLALRGNHEISVYINALQVSTQQSFKEAEKIVDHLELHTIGPKRGYVIKDSPRTVAQTKFLDKYFYYEKIGDSAKPGDSTPIQLNLYDVYIGPSPIGSARILVLADSEATARMAVEHQYSELKDCVERITLVDGPFVNGRILCGINPGARFNHLHPRDFPKG